METDFHKNLQYTRNYLPLRRNAATCRLVYSELSKRLAREVTARFTPSSVASLLQSHLVAQAIDVTNSFFFMSLSTGHCYRSLHCLPRHNFKGLCHDSRVHFGRIHSQHWRADFVFVCWHLHYSYVISKSFSKPNSFYWQIAFAANESTLCFVCQLRVLIRNTCGGVCRRAVNASNFDLFSFPPRCFLRQGTLLYKWCING